MVPHFTNTFPKDLITLKMLIKGFINEKFSNPILRKWEPFLIFCNKNLSTQIRTYEPNQQNPYPSSGRQ